MFKINKVVRTLILSDFLLQSGWGLMGPIFAIYFTKQIQGADLKMIGLFAATFWVVKSIAQPFIANYLDKNHGERDDFIFLVGGMYVANLTFLGYIFASQPWHIFFLEGTRGLAMACVIPNWYAIFTRHIDKKREAFSWSLESTGIGLAAGIAGALGGLLANVFGFKIVFVLVTLFGFIASSILLIIRRDIFSKDRFIPRIFPKEKTL